MTDKFPFAFDAKSMQDMFNGPFEKMFEPNFDAFNLDAFNFGTFQEAQTKNMNALVEANKVAASGYQTLYKRMTELFDASLADAKDRMSEAQGQPMTADVASKNAEALKATFEKALADVKEIAEMATTANAGAFDVIKARTEEIFAEVKAATDKIAA